MSAAWLWGWKRSEVGWGTWKINSECGCKRLGWTSSLPSLQRGTWVTTGSPSSLQPPALTHIWPPVLPWSPLPSPGSHSGLRLQFPSVKGGTVPIQAQVSAPTEEAGPAPSSADSGNGFYQPTVLNQQYRLVFWECNNTFSDLSPGVRVCPVTFRSPWGGRPFTGYRGRESMDWNINLECIYVCILSFFL